MSFPLKRSHSCHSLSSNKSKSKSDYLSGFHTGRHLQWTLNGASIPYSLAHIIDEGWLIGDEGGNIWSRSDSTNSTSSNSSFDPFENILEFESGVSEIAALDRSKVLIGEMRGNVTQIDLNNLSEETISTVKGINHRAPIKCIRWQPNQMDVFATASQDGSIIFADLRCPERIMGTLTGAHQLNNMNSKTSKGRSTMTGLVFNPLRSELFYTTGTPDTCIRLWDMRKLSDYSVKMTTIKRQKKTPTLSPLEEFSTASYTSRRHRSSISLTTDSIGSRLFLATSNDNIYEFLTNNPEIGPVASYTAPGYNSCSFFSNLSIDPTDRFILSGSSSGQAFIWDTMSKDCVFELPVCAQLEVSKTAWAGGKRGSLEAQIACISDDLTFSLFNWNLDISQEPEALSIKTAKRHSGLNFRESIQRDDNPLEKEDDIPSLPPTAGTLASSSLPVSNCPSFPLTPIRKQSQQRFLNIGTPPNSANKSILDFFSRSPRIEPQ